MDLEAKGIRDMAELLVESELDNKKNMSEERDGSAGTSSSVVRWERFLPKMVLRVLLVEGDDSTRQIIAALLRKCSYKVAAVSDGLKAWELLKGRPHNIDLILTEVDLPSISGCTLLASIMEHEVCKNIPVIMMSSNDSVSTVYRCMLRGAADFLVKPVRKNELRNLWQHVWRRQASTGSAQGPLDESVAQQKVEATAENNACSNRSSGYEACVQRNRECIEKGSDAQSSCTKPEFENEGESTEDIPESIQPNRNASLSNIDLRKEEVYHESTIRLRMSENDAGGVAPGEDASTMIRREYVSSDDNWGHVRTTGQTSDNHPAPLTKQAIDLIGAFDNYHKCNFKSSGSNISTNDSSPLLDLSLTRSNPSGSVNQYTDEKHGLNHSDVSAFSRYVNKAMQSNQSMSAMTCNQQQNYETDSDKQFSSHSIDYNFDSRGPMTRPHDHVSPTCGEPGLGLCSSHKSSMPHPVSVRGIRFEGQNSAYSSMIAPLLYTPSGIPLHCQGSATPRDSSYQENSSTPRESSNQTNPTTSRESSYLTNPFIRLNCETRNSQQLHSPADQNNSNSITRNEGNIGHKSEPAIDCRNFPSTIDQSTNHSCCSSAISHLHLNCGSSENISLPAVKSQAECWKEEGSHTPDVNSHQSQREAALLKFRMKRKDRCFDKKVRYESRKKLAEQRPRVKGQFVRQVPSELVSNS